MGITEEYINEFQQQIAELENMVEAYARHTPDCDVMNDTPNDEADTTIRKCTCGYKSAVAEYFHKHAVDEDYGYQTQKNFD